MVAVESKDSNEWKEETETPSEIYNWRVYFCSGIAAFAAVMIGYDSAFIGTTLALAAFKNEFGLSKVSTASFNFLSANIVSTFQGGCFFGAFAAWPIGYFIGRKYGIMLSAAFFVFGSGLMLGANHSRGLGLIYAGRIIAGLGVGAASNLTPCYISEIAPAAIRGRLLGLYELSWQIGGIVGFWINYGVNLHIPSSHKQWVIPFAIQLVPGGMLLAGSFFMVESPRWLQSRGRGEAALKNLCYIRNLPADHPYIIRQYENTQNALDHEQSLSGAGFLAPMMEVFKSKALFARLCLASSLFIWQNGTGINAINYYSPTIFKSIGISGTSTSLLTTGVYGVIKTVGAIVWLLFVVDKFGRRNTLLIGSIGGAFCMYYIGAYIKISGSIAHPSAKLTPGGQSALAFLYLWTVFYSPTWNGTPWVVGAEIFPQQVRVFSQAVVAASNWFWGFIIARFTPNMFTTMGFGVYIFFATMMVLSIPFVYFILPETARIPLERMDELFAPGLPARRAHAVVMADMRERAAITTSAEGSEKGEEKRIEHV